MSLVEMKMPEELPYPVAPKSLQAEVVENMNARSDQQN
jgi:hypothetical protein